MHKILSSFKRITSAAPIVAVVVILMAAVVGYFVLPRPSSSRASSSTGSVGNSCTQSTATAAGAAAAGVTFPVQVAHPTNPANEPAVVATANGANITATTLEARVDAIHANDVHQLATLPANAPAAVRAQLSESVNQIRQQALTRMIDDMLLTQAGQRNGLYASAAEAKAYAKSVVSQVQSLSVTDPVRVQFAAYLCAYHLTVATFATNPQVIQGYQMSLTIAAVKKHYLATLPATQTRTAAASNQALATYEQQLWQSGRVQIFLPSSLT